jgi:hypothetical protein
MPRPKGSTGTRHLTVDKRQRVRTLYFNAHMSKPEIKRRTGYTKDQIRHALKSESAAIKPRSGRLRVMTPE